MSTMNRTELIKRLKEIKVILNKTVTLRSGEISEYYCDMKKAYGYPDILNALADEIIKILPKETTVIVSSGYGGLPFGVVVALKSGKKFTAVRDSVKDHGKGGKIDGYMPNDQDVVVIVDDVLTTGHSIRTTFSGLSEAGIKCNSAAVIVKRSEASLDIPCVNVFDIKDIYGTN